MSPQGTTLAAKPEAGMVVDAYVDALLAMPVAAAAPAPADPHQPLASTAPDEVADHAAPQDAPVPEAAAVVPDALAVEGYLDAAAWRPAPACPSAWPGACRTRA